MILIGGYGDMYLFLERHVPIFKGPPNCVFTSRYPNNEFIYSSVHMCNKYDLQQAGAWMMIKRSGVGVGTGSYVNCQFDV